jgi:hypothetical protein
MKRCQAIAGRVETGGFFGRLVVVVAEPRAGDQRRGVADEPGVAEILRGAGLARRRPAGELGLAAGAVVSVALSMAFIMPT